MVVKSDDEYNALKALTTEFSKYMIKVASVSGISDKLKEELKL